MTAPRPTDHLGEVYAEWAVEMGRYPDMSIELLRIIFDDWQRVTGEPEGVTYRDTEIGGVPGILVAPQGSDPRQVLVLLHGGGFALGSSRSHRKLAGHLAKAAGTTAFVADFRLAPEHKFPAAIEDGVAVVRPARGGPPGEDVNLVGDSAGGNSPSRPCWSCASSASRCRPRCSRCRPGSTWRTRDRPSRRTTHRFPHRPRGPAGEHRPLHRGVVSPTDPREPALTPTSRASPPLHHGPTPSRSSTTACGCTSARRPPAWTWPSPSARACSTCSVPRRAAPARRRGRSRAWPSGIAPAADASHFIRTLEKETQRP